MNIAQLNTSDHYSHNTSTDIDVVAILAPHFHSFNFGNEDQHIFSISPQCARYLLHNLKHPVLTDGDVKRSQWLSKRISVGSLADSWPKHPIVIDSPTGTIIEGIKRLYAVGNASKSEYLWIGVV